ncbi:hypothetical protein F5Y18DRAFT_99286 [Xylariaceae sp. FL1019]|nr:hypothetical protein F5Y18DRAFT_99286 [Xylariaceae sp. FL1019]
MFIGFKTKMFLCLATQRGVISASHPHMARPGKFSIVERMVMVFFFLKPTEYIRIYHEPSISHKMNPNRPNDKVVVTQDFFSGGISTHIHRRSTAPVIETIIKSSVGVVSILCQNDWPAL